MTDQTNESRPVRRRARALEPSVAGKEDLVRFVSSDLDTTKHDGQRIVESVVRGIQALTKRYNLLRVPGLGHFRVQETAPRAGRNPRTGETVAIGAGRRVTFRAAKAYKSAVGRRG